MGAAQHQRNVPQNLDIPPDSINTHSLPVIPQQIDAERSVLGALLISNDQFERVVEFLAKDDFYHHKHRLIYDAMSNLYERREKIDLITMKDHLEKIGELDNIGGVNYLAEIAHETPYSINAESYARIVRDCSILRRLLGCTKEIQEMVYSRGEATVDDILSKVQQKVYELGNKYDKNPSLVHIKNSAIDAFKNIEELYKNGGNSGITGIPSGFIDLDKKTSGFQRSDLIIIAGRPSMGKTALAMNIAENAAIEEKLNVVVFSLEMTALQLSMRSLSSLSSINTGIIRSGALGDGQEGVENWTKLDHALSLLDKAPIYIDSTPGISPLQITAISRRMQRDVGIDLIIIDYLQLLQMKDNESNRATELSNITRELKFLAKELDVPVIALSQLNRSVESRPNKRPLMSDLRESGAIEQDADLILFIYRDEVYDKTSKHVGIAEVNVAKHRNGEIGPVKLCFMGEYTRFENYVDSGVINPNLDYDIDHD